jgi:hypothetical protein
MYISDRWISLKQVHDTLFEFFHDCDEFEGDIFGASSAAMRQTWKFCASRKTVRIALFDGKTKVIPTRIFGDADLHQFLSPENDHVNINDGWLGSGRKREEISELSDGSHAHPEYGPLLGLHIVFEKKEFEILLKELKGEIKTLPVKSKAALTNAILAAHTSGELKNRAWAKKQLSDGFTNSMFNAAWLDAVTIDPSLKKPGRKSKLKVDINPTY